MSQNTSQNQESTPKKRFPLFSTLLALAIILIIGGAAYFALFPDKNIQIPFISQENEQKIHTLLENSTGLQQSQSTTEQPKTENKTSSYQTANDIFEKLTTATTQTEPQKQASKQHSEQNLNVVDMSQKSEQKKAEADNSDEFSLTPPNTSNPLESGRRMLTEEEIKAAQEKDRQEKRAKLEALRNSKNNLSNEEKNSLPIREGTLSSLTPDTQMDPVITLFFIQDLAEYLVTNYKTISMPKLNQRYGVGLYGLEHAKGRQGVLEYAYDDDMIPLLYKHLSPFLIKAMKNVAQQKNMSNSDQTSMFKKYAKISEDYSNAINELNNMPQLSENLQNLRVIENDLKKEEKYFAENLLRFEQNRENKNLARSFEQNIKNSTIRSEQLRSRIKTVAKEMKLYFSEYSEHLARIPDVLELAQWLDRRNNPSANAVFAEVLSKFSQEMSQLAHD